MDDGWTWLREASRATPGPPDQARGQVVAGVALAVARRREVRLPDLALLSSWGSPADVTVPDGVTADPWLIGAALEVLLDQGDRRRRGSHYTPRAVAETVTGLAFGGLTADASTVVCDASVGGGAFLLAAADALHAVGVPRRVAVRNLTGADIDPLAVAVTEAALSLWAGGGDPGTIAVADALGRPADAWGAPDVVVGNPPFLGQLRSATVRAPDRTALRSELAALTGPYTDTSALFAALATEVVAPGGRVALVLPRSFLGARDAGPARAATLHAATLNHVWIPGRRLFDAAVDVCVPVWTRRSADRRSTCLPSPTSWALSNISGAAASTAPDPACPEVTRSTGVPPVPAPPTAPVTLDRPSWSHLLAGLDGEPGVPSLDGLRSGGVLGDHCTATAGFRDQYYGLVPFTVDDPDGRLGDQTHAPLVTSGLIDPATSEWGRRTTRYAGRRWEAPRVDVGAVLDAGGSLARWTLGKRVPKLLVAAQTRTIEAVADVGGTWLPSTPVATVVPDPDSYWHVLAVLLSPVATAWALLHQRGTGLSPGSIRLPPAALRAIPTPADRACWDEAAADVRLASHATAPSARSALLTSAAVAMCAAYGVAIEPSVGWWRARQPVR